ncbi:MAG: sn-glycerol-3-phosphate ABC transporter ATP-binding protein UgpC [Gemmatimonadota bacterium]|nr:sn-glycerol-3-phosphate ABC transporter ATP-binding protein UgpC [Gemmatimonadota bacterium]
MATVVLKNVRKIYSGNTVAVDDFSLRVEDGEFVVLVGPSGCGKSTTLRLIAGLEEVNGGEIHIDGCLANDLPPKDRNIAMVFQNYALYPHMDAYRNMAFGLKLRKYPGAEIDKRVREAADVLGIEDLLRRKPKELSGGQRQRVALGRAIVRKPKVFLFDEPLSNLDARLRVQMRMELGKLHTRLAATMIYVTHDQVEAMTMGDRLVVMRDGRIQQIGAPVQLYRRPVNRFVAGFIGSPSMNFLEGELVRDGGLAFRGDGLRLPIPDRHGGILSGRVGRRVILGIRPEHILFASSAHGVREAEAVTAKIEVVEPMGHETYLYLAVGRASFVARVAADDTPAVKGEVRLAFDLSALHFFDRETEAALLRAPAG